MASQLEVVGIRFADKYRAWQAAENTSITDWVIGDSFIVAAAYKNKTPKAMNSSTVRLRWRDVTDEGSFANLGSSGELNWNGITALVNGNAVTAQEATFDDDVDTYVEGIERAGANDVSVTLFYGYGTECHWAVNTDNAEAGHEYAFELYDNSSGVSIGTLAATITMAGGGETISPDAATAVGVVSNPTVSVADVVIFITPGTPAGAIGSVTSPFVDMWGLNVNVFVIPETSGALEWAQRELSTSAFTARSINTTSFTERTLSTLSFTERTISTLSYTRKGMSRITYDREQLNG